LTDPTILENRFFKKPNKKNPKPKKKIIYSKIGYKNSQITTMDISTFDGRLYYSSYLRDPQIILDWLQSMDKYFIWYPLSEAEKVRFATKKLTAQANQYWTDFVNRRVLRG